MKSYIGLFVRGVSMSKTYKPSCNDFLLKTCQKCFYTNQQGLKFELLRKGYLVF